MAEGVATHWFGYLGSSRRGFYVPLDGGLVVVVAAPLARHGVDIGADGWKYPLPHPVT
jgi:hypothetical protein